MLKSLLINTEKAACIHQVLVSMKSWWSVHGGSDVDHVIRNCYLEFIKIILYFLSNYYYQFIGFKILKHCLLSFRFNLNQMLPQIYIDTSSLDNFPKSISILLTCKYSMEKSNVTFSNFAVLLMMPINFTSKCLLPTKCLKKLFCIISTGYFLISKAS